MQNQQVLLVARPTGEVTRDCFQHVTTPLPALAEGQVLVRHHWLSLDPYMRGRMNEGRSYAPPQPLGAVMVGGTAGVVVESRDPRFAAGDPVVGMGGWQEYSVVDAGKPGMMRKVDTTHIPLPAWLGPVGMPGVTAWVGLHRILEARAGQTIVVSAASGAVGSVVGQLARLAGARAVGIAGGAEKCAYVTGELGFDACIDYKAHAEPRAFSAALRAACPDGIDGDFENVGGSILDAVMLQANDFARFAICGMISGYDGVPIPMQWPQLILTRRLTMRGFIVSEHMDAWPPALQELGTLVATGRLRYRESIADGLASAPDAFIGMLKGRNFGKQLVRLA